MGFENVGLIWTPDSLAQYLATIQRPNWCTAVTLHHTAAPSLAQRPKGFLIDHIKNLQNFFQNEKKWSAGPHLFIDDDEIFGMSDLRRKGVHAVSFNSSAIGIEVLGDYDSENPLNGRGLACWSTAAAATRALLDWLGFKPDKDTVLFHRDDPTTKKSCPGSLVKKDWVLGLIENPVAHREAADPSKPDVGMEWESWDFRGERWCVPVLEFLEAKGIPSETIIANLKSRGGLFFYGNELLEGAYYVPEGSSRKPDGRTWAPVRELTELVEA